MCRAFEITIVVVRTLRMKLLQAFNAERLLWRAIGLSIVGLRKEVRKNGSKRPTYVSIAFSHFCEKSRFMMDLSPLEYDEEQHLPAVHGVRTAGLSKLPRLSLTDYLDQNPQTDQKLRARKEKTSVPKLLLFDQLGNSDNYSSVKVLKDGSSGITEYLLTKYPEEMTFLRPAELKEKIIELELWLDNVFAYAITDWAFGSLLLENAVSRQLFIERCRSSTITPAIERFWFNLLADRYMVPLMVRVNRVSEEARDRAKPVIEETFQKIDAMYKQHGSNSSKYIFGTDRPTSADITFAAFCSALLLPPQTNQLYVDREEMKKRSDPMIIFADEMIRKYRSAEKVMQIYHEDRPPIKCFKQ